MAKTFIQLLLFGLLVLSGCSTSKVDYDKSAPFDTYFTYDFRRPNPAELKEAGVEHPGNMIMVEAAIAEQMAKKGYKNQPEDPDLWVYYFAVVDIKQKASTVGVSVGGGSYNRSGGFGYSVGTSTTRLTDYKDGTLIIDLIDTKLNKLVWTGSAGDTFGKNDRVQEKVFKIVDKIFYSYKASAGNKLK